MKIERNIPLRTKVADHLREIILQKYSDGTKIPTENQLAEEIGVSRGTVSQALSILNEEGIIDRIQGSGTYANPHILQLKIRADLPFRLAGLIESSGYKPSISIVDHQITSASEETAENLKIPIGSRILMLNRLYLADEEPAMFLIERFPTSILCDTYQPSELQQMLYHFLPNRCNVHLKYTLSELVPTIAGKEIADYLNVNPESALLRCNEIHFDENNIPIADSTIFYKDELIRFSILRKNN